MSELRLGAFTLHEPLGRGGMGEVWRATHRDGTPVAVKVVGQAQVHTPEARRALRNEIRAVAGLDHPAIVAVFDAGTVDQAADDASAGALAWGSPWVAIELCSEGSLLQCPPTDWPGLRGLLLTLLDALAHVHARGMVHRDLKPANVLRCGLDAPRPGWRLADFGVARVLHHTARSSSTGTPRYMAPEQIRGQSWRLGPHSDLFSLGCVAWEQAAGTPHRRGTSLDALLHEQATEPLPPLAPVLPVPAGFAEWVAALTELEPDDRPQSAVQAARALMSLGEADAAPVPRPARLDDAQTFSLTTVLEPVVLPETDVRPDDAPAVAPRILPAWPLPSDAAVSPRLGDAGLGLLPHRPVPLVGREGLQDRLWRALAGPVERHTTEVIWLRGPSGTGKSRLARWLVERAAELGLAHPVRVALRGEASDDLARTLMRVHGTDGLDLHGTRRTLAQQGIDPDQAAALAAWWVERSGGAAEHASLAGSRLAALATRRGPLVVWLDEAHHRPEAMLLASRLVDERVPGLVVLTTDDEVTAGSDVEDDLEALVARAAGWSHRLAPLTGAHRHALVVGALGLEPSLAADVAERSAGNPGLAIAMVHHLASVRALRWSRHGFGLAPGARGPTVSHGDGPWALRLRSALHGLSDVGQRAIAAGAVAGIEVAPATWAVACAALGVPADPEALRPLADAALARVDADGSWAFAHAALLPAARSVLGADQLRAVHRAIGEAAARPEVRGTHLLAAGALAQALDPLVDAAEALSLVGEMKLALRRMGEWLDAADQLELAPADPRRVKGLSRLAAVHRQLGQLDEAAARCAEVLAHAEAGSRWRAAGLAETAVIAGIRGDLETALSGLAEAARAFDLAGEPSLAEGCRVSVALAHLSSGRTGEAETLLATLQPVGAKGRARLARLATVLAIHLGDHDRARVHGHEALRAHREAANLHGVANALCELGTLEQRAGDLDLALAHFRAAAAHWRALGAYQAPEAELDVAQVHGERGEWAECRARASAALTQLERRDDGADRSRALAVMVSAAAALRDWPAFDRHLHRLGTDVDVAPHLSDVQHSLQAAAREARAAGDPTRAEAALEVLEGLVTRTHAAG